jgi:hypothetical protein
MKQGQSKGVAAANLADRLALYFSTGTYVDGLWIGAWEDQPEPILRRIEAALSLIKRHDRVRYDRLIRDLDRIWVIVLASPRACFDYKTYACQIDSRYFLAETTTLELIASTIVHEATHARLWRRGFRYEEARRRRIEAICIRRQIAFASRLPNGRTARDSAERTLTLCASDDYWTNKAFHDRHIEDGIAALRHLGAPEWLLRILPAAMAVATAVRRGWRMCRRRHRDAAT